MNPSTLIRAAALICAAFGAWSVDCHIANSGTTSFYTPANGAGGQSQPFNGGTIQLTTAPMSDYARAAVWEHEITHVKDGKIPGAQSTRAWCLQSEQNAYTAQIQMFDWATDTFGPIPDTDDWTANMNADLHRDFWFVDNNMRLVKVAQCNAAFGFR